MSHVIDMGLPITDLKIFGQALEDLGLEIRQKTTFNWYGHHVGDYPLPVGFTKEDMGKCDFAVGVKGNLDAYEIGVVRRRDGGKGYALLLDFYAGGRGLINAIGENGGKLKQRYNTRSLMNEARRNGYRVSETMTEDGQVKISIRS